MNHVPMTPPLAPATAEALPSISIVTCSYGQARFLDSTIRSVLNQDYPKLQYLILDGGSTDGSVDVIRKHASRLHYWHSERDAGQVDALRKGFDRSTGEVQGWLCSDDLLLPGALHRVGTFFAEHPDVDFVFGDGLWIDSNGDLIRPKKEMRWNRFVMLFDHNYLAQPACFWRKRLYDAVGGLDPSFNLAMDSDLWLRFSNRTRPVHLPSYLACMRYYPEQKTRALKPQGRAEDARLRQREWPSLAPWPPLLTRSVARAGRIGLKLASGGYGAAPPSTMQPWLQQLRTPGQAT